MRSSLPRSVSASVDAESTLSFSCRCSSCSLSLSGAAYRVAWFILVAVYDIGGVAIWGQTIGKRLLGTKLVNITDEPLRPWQAVVRFATYGIPALIFTAGLPHRCRPLVAYRVCPPCCVDRGIVVCTMSWAARS
jgi:uncharacterized RDD family membrane protein YckC